MDRKILLLVLVGLFLGGDDLVAQESFKDSVELYFSRGMYKEAKVFGEKQVKKIKLTGEENLDYASALSDLASVNQALGNYSYADSLFKTTMTIQKKLLGEKSEDYAITLINIGNLYTAMGNNGDAEYFELEALKIYQDLKIESEEYIALLNNIGLLNQNIGKLSIAKEYYLQVQKLRKKLGSENTTNYTIVLNNLGVIGYLTGNYNDAERYFTESIKLKRKIIPQNLPDIAFSLSNFASFYTKIDNNIAAESLILEAIEIRKKTLGENHPDYAVALGNWANILKAQKKYVTADSVYQLSLKIIKAAVSENHQYYIGALTNLAIFYSQIQKFNEADTLFKQALVICKRTAGENSIQYALILRSMGRMHFFMNNYTLALPSFYQALKISKNVVGENHPDYANTMVYIAELSITAKKNDDAEFYIKSVLSLEKKFLFNKLDFLSETELLPYLKGRESSFVLPYSCLWHLNSPQLIQAAYNCNLLLKGVAIQNANSLANQMGQSKDSLMVNLWKEYKNSKSLLNKILSQPIVKRTTNTDSLTNITNQQEKELLRQSVDFRNMKENLNTSWQDVRNNLQPNEAAIEFVKFNNLKRKLAAPDTVYYAAMLLRSKDTVPIFIKLFEESELKAALNKFAYKAATENRSISKDSKPTLTKNIKSNIYNLVWQPLAPYLTKTTTIYFAPDGLLHHLAFAAIPTNNGTLLCDKYNLIQLTSTRQIAIKENENIAPTSITLFGGINYNKQNTDTTIAVSADPYAYVYQQSRSAGVDSFVYLPNTLKEVESIKRKMELKQNKVSLFTNENATEAAFRNLGGASSPQVIHFATHGFTVADTSNSRKNITNTFKISDNPLLRSGLVMAGGNKGWKGKSNLNEDDGILTALEISSVALPNTQLAVLSACETGIGELRGSEGVFGLQRAFKLAGVNYVMASLWQVPDKETSEFMNTFYTNWLAGKSIRKAFTTTQQTMRKKYTPYYWAAFTLVQ